MYRPNITKANNKIENLKNHCDVFIHSVIKTIDQLARYTLKLKLIINSEKDSLPDADIVQYVS